MPGDASFLRELAEQALACEPEAAHDREANLARALIAALDVIAACDKHRKTAESAGLGGKPMTCYCPICTELRTFDAFQQESADAR